MLTTHFHLVSRLRLRGAIPLLRLYACMAWTGTNLRFIFLGTRLAENVWNFQDFCLSDRSLDVRPCDRSPQHRFSDFSLSSLKCGYGFRVARCYCVLILQPPNVAFMLCRQ
jgi:hypothetical protein